MRKTITIGERIIGDNHPCFIVAEAGANHDGDFNKAKALIDAASSTKASAIKFQHYKAEKLTAKEAKRYWYVHGDEQGFQFDPNTYKDDQRSTFGKIDGIPREKDMELLTYADEKNILFFSTPFDFESVDHLEKIGNPMYKIASGDITYHDFLRYVASTGKPIILSTGASTLSEIRDAVNVVKQTGNEKIILLHCTLAYPTPLHKANLLMMRHLQEVFPEVMIGLSDHTPGIAADVAAALLGAVMIEKHFTHTPGHAAGSDKVGDSPDHDIGIGAPTFTELVSAIRENEKKGLTFEKLGIEKALEIIKNSNPEVLGKVSTKEVDNDVELKACAQARRSVVTEKALLAGTVITRDMLSNGTFAIKRPGTGILPYELPKLEGKKIKQDVLADTVVTWSHLV